MVISVWDLVFRYWDKWLFLSGILCLGTGIKSYFCLGSCFRYWDKWLFLSGILCLGTGINGYFCLESCV